MCCERFDRSKCVHYTMPVCMKGMGEGAHTHTCQKTYRVSTVWVGRPRFWAASLVKNMRAMTAITRAIFENLVFMDLQIAPTQ